MDSQPPVPPSISPTTGLSTGSYQNSGKSGRNKMLLGLSSVVVVVMTAGITYTVLSMTTGQKANETGQVAKIQKTETPDTIDTQIQSYMQSEQKLEEALSDSESQSVVDDANSPQTLEGNYANF